MHFYFGQIIFLLSFLFFFLRGIVLHYFHSLVNVLLCVCKVSMTIWKGSVFLYIRYKMSCSHVPSLLVLIFKFYIIPSLLVLIFKFYIIIIFSESHPCINLPYNLQIKCDLWIIFCLKTINVENACNNIWQKFIIVTVRYIWW